MLEKAGLTLIIMLSKTKKVFTTHLTVLCSIASYKLFYRITWRVETLSLLFVPPTERRRNGDYYVKRVIAAAGDTIEIKDGNVYLNEEILDEPYIQGRTFVQEGAVRYPLTLEEDQLFVMGDNREASMDSRTFGAVGKRQIKGKILLQGGKFYIRKTK